MKPNSNHLSDIYVISESFEADGSPVPVLQQDAGREWIKRLKFHIARGTDLIQIRLKQLDSKQLESVLTECRALARNNGTKLVLNGASGVAEEYGLDGIHLTSDALFALQQRPLPRLFLVGASCHSIKELQYAEKIGCDFACLSPVNPTKSYAEQDILGMETFADWISQLSMPVYALGGMTQGDLPEIKNRGGQGVAGISAFW